MTSRDPGTGLACSPLTVELHQLATLLVKDSEFMRRALKLARRGVGLTSPNPPVGAVIVKDGRELGAGWHREAGEAHAEVEAIRAAQIRHGSTALAGATIYVTLEPCSTVGRTGACTTAIQRAGLKRVVIGAGDPNPAHSGQAAGILEAAGLEVVEAIEEAACEELIRPFSKVQKTGLPWVVIKTAMSLDGRITRSPREGPWISSAESREDVQKLRIEADAILTSGRTVRSDNPSLTLRSLDVPEEKKQPWRVVLTSRDEGVPAASKLLHDEYCDRTLVFTRQRIECVLRELVAERDVTTVLVEAGGRLVGRLLDEGWADELVIYLAPILSGGQVPATGGEGVPDLHHRQNLEGIRFKRIGSDVRLRAVLGATGGPLER